MGARLLAAKEEVAARQPGLSRCIPCLSDFIIVIITILIIDNNNIIVIIIIY